MLTSLEYVEFSVLLTDVPLSIELLKCQFVMQNSSIMTVNVTITNNPRYFICTFYPQSYGPLSDLNISILLGSESVAMVNNGGTT